MRATLAGSGPVCCLHAVMSLDRTSSDVVVVGAGAAGLAAARTLRARDLGVRVLEAKKRIGGRAWTDTETFGVPLDWGCHWLHSASINPFTTMADEWGCAYRTGSVRRRVHTGTSWETDAEYEERIRFLRRCWDTVGAAGEAGRDVSVADVTERDHRWTPVFDFWVTVTSGFEPQYVSTLDLARYRDTGENWPLEDGYGALVARLGEGLDITLGTRVHRIDWAGPRVRVHTSRGVLDAAAVIVTVSSGVLASGDIRFDPPLPAWKLAAIEAVPLGQANKIAFQLPGNPLGLPAHGHALPGGTAPATAAFQVRPFGRDLLVGYVGGYFCLELERAGEEAMIAFGLERLVEVFGSDVRRHVTRAACSHWGTDADIRGGYSCAPPGAADRRTDMATPLAERVYFAGEACSADFFSTAHGAYLSGIAGAEAVVRALRKDFDETTRGAHS